MSVRRLLVISHDFHPAERIGAFRISGLARYLPAHGVEVHVLAGPWAESPGPVGLASVLGVEAPGPAMARSSVSYVSGSGRKRRSLVLRDRLAEAGARGGPGALVRALPRKLLSAYAFLTFAEHRHWVQRVARRALDGEAHGCDAVLGTYGGEYWNLGAAHRVARRLGLPLVLDFRDGWDWFHGFNGLRSPVYPLMRRYVADARLAVCATPSVAERLLEYWPATATAVVASGFDPTVLPAPIASAPPVARASVRIGHFGTLWESRHWALVAQAISTLSRSRSVVVFYRGRNRDAFEREVVRRCAGTVEFDLADMCSRAEARRLLVDVDVVLASTPDPYPGAVPSKIDEAIGMAKPFMVLDGTRSARLSEHLAGCPTPHLVVRDETGPDAVRRFLENPPAAPARDDPRLAAYSIERRAGELARLLVDL